MKSKKGFAFVMLQGLILSLVVVGIVLGVGFIILSKVGSMDDVQNNKNATVAVNETIDAMADIPGWLPIIVVVLVGAILIMAIGIFRGANP